MAGTPPLSRYYGALAELHRWGVSVSQLAVLFPLTEARIRQLLRRRGQRVRTQPGAARPAREMLVQTLARHGLTFDDLCGVRDVEDPGDKGNEEAIDEVKLRRPRRIPKGYATIHEITDQLGCSRSQLTRLIATGRVLSKRVGLRRFVQVASLRRYLEGGRRVSWLERKRAPTKKTKPLAKTPRA